MPLCVTAVTPSRAEGSVRLCRKTRSGFERLILRLTASGCIDDKTNIACFGSLGVARDRLCQAKNRSLSGRRRSFQTEPRTDFSAPRCCASLRSK